MEFQVNEVSLRRGQRATATKSTNQPAIELLQHQYGCFTCCFVCMHMIVRVSLYVGVCVFARMRVCLCALCVAVLSPHAAHVPHATCYISYAISTHTHTQTNQTIPKEV